ncbi:11714_t:CDS:2 [Entrophospora sp. SA101]|nr:11714_t:CDS:2 [Entrophospora sp. SA101]
MKLTKFFSSATPSKLKPTHQSINNNKQYFYSSPNTSSQSLSFDEDLDDNLFYKTLKKDYQKIFHKVSIICVPHSKSILGLRMSKNFIESHSFIPSPYFQGQFQSINDKVMIIENNHVKTLKGFKEERIIRILSDELVYNEAYKSVQVLVLEMPLEGEWKKMNSEKFGGICIPPERNHEMDLQFLKNILSSSHNDSSIKSMEDMVEEFKETYVYVRGYAGFTVDKISQIFQKSVLSFLESNETLRLICQLPHEHDYFLELVENILMNALHEKIFIQSLLPIYHSHDTYLESILNVYANAHITLKDYGVSERLQDIPVEMLESAREILKLIDGDNNECESTTISSYAGLGITNIDDQDDKKLTHNENFLASIPSTTPLEKLFYEGSLITTDDFIPLLAYVIVNSRLNHLASVLFYMRTFRLSKIERSELSFALTTLQASTEFIKSDPLSIHDAISTTSSISSISSSHSSFKFPSPLINSSNRIRSRATSISTPSSPIISSQLNNPNINNNVSTNHSSNYSVTTPTTSSQSSSNNRRDKSPARSFTSTTSSRTSPSAIVNSNRNRNSHSDEINSSSSSFTSTTSSGKLSFDNYYYNSNNNSPFCVPTIEDNHHDVHQPPQPSVRRRRSSIAPGGLVIKPQILLVPSRSPQPRTKIITITPRTSSHANGGGSNSNNYISFSKPILEVTTPKPEILGDFLSGLQNIDGDVVSGDRNGGFKVRKW